MDGLFFEFGSGRTMSIKVWTAELSAVPHTVGCWLLNPKKKMANMDNWSRALIKWGKGFCAYAVLRAEMCIGLPARLNPYRDCTRLILSFSCVWLHARYIERAEQRMNTSTIDAIRWAKDRATWLALVEAAPAYVSGCAS